MRPNTSQSAIVLLALTSVAFGQKAADATALQAAAVKRGAVRVLGDPIRAHDNMAVSVDFAADGRCVSAGWDRTARIWTLDESRASKVIAAGGTLLVFAQFCDRDRSVVTADNDGVLVRWNAKTGAEQARLTADPAPRVGAASPDGRWLATAAMGAVAIRDGRSLEVAAEVPFGTMPTCLAWSPDGRHLVVGGAERITVFDREAGEVVSERAAESMVQSVAVHPRGDRLAVGAWNSVQVFGFPALGDEPDDALGGFQTGVTGIHWNGANAVVFGDEDGTIANLDFDKKAFTWSAAEHQSSVPSLALSADGTIVASASRDTRVRFWSAADGREMFRSPGNRDAVFAVAFSSDGSRIYAGDFGNCVAIYTADGTAPPRSAIAHEFSVIAVRAHGDDQLRSFGYDETIRTLRAKDAGEAAATRLALGEGLFVTAFAFGPEAGWVGCNDGRARRVDPATGSVVGDPLDQGSPIVRVAVSADGGRIATVGEDGGIVLWSSEGKAVATLVDVSEQPFEITFAGDAVAAARADGELRIWSAKDGAPRHTAPADPEPDFVGCIAGSADGTRIATGHLGRIRIWNAATGELERSTAAYVSLPQSAAFAPDGEHLATGMKDGTVLVWKVDEIGAGERD